MSTQDTSAKQRRRSRDGLLPVVSLALTLAAAAIWYAGGGAVWYQEGGAGWLPYLLVLGIWPLRWAVVGLRVKRTPVTGGLVLFVASGAIAVWAAYALGPAVSKFGLIVGAVSLCAAMSHQRRWWQVYLGLAALGGLAVALALYFVASNDWSTDPVKMGLMNRIGGMIARLLPSIGGHRISPNVAGGLLASLAPVFVPLIWLAWDEWQGFAKRPGLAHVLAALSAVGGAFVLLVLLVTSSRGAWLGAALAAGVWVWWRWLGDESRRRTRDRRKAWDLRLRAMGLSVGLGALLLVGAAVAITRHDLPGAGSLSNRLGLYRDALLLARDYWLTGAGLGVFEMQFSIYTLLIHVGYIVNAHNVLIDLLIEQGILGLVGYVWVLGSVVRHGAKRLRRASAHVRWILEATLLCALVAATHGLFDDVHYGSRALLFMYAPVGLLLAAGRLEQRSHGERSTRHMDWRPWATLGVSALVILLVGWRLVISQGWATLGAIEQSRIELNVYDQNDFHALSMDDVRRQEDLSRPIALLERAIVRGPRTGNLLAQQRLAGIAMARGEYGTALALMQASWTAGHRDSVTSMLMGDALVAHGRRVEAAQVLDGLPWALDRLNGQAWDRYYRRGDITRAIDAWETVLLLDPTSSYAGEWLEKARAQQ